MADQQQQQQQQPQQHGYPDQPTYNPQDYAQHPIDPTAPQTHAAPLTEGYYAPAPGLNSTNVPPPPAYEGHPSAQFSAQPSEAATLAQQGQPTTGDLKAASGGDGGYQPPLPPRRAAQNFGDDDPSDPVHYTRDPHKLIAYLVPFPKPTLKDVPATQIPDRFLIYTPPPPPLAKPAEGEKEAKVHKLQRKWQEEVREAKTSTAKTASWKGIKSKATKGISWAINQTTTSNLDFINRIGGGGDDSLKENKDKHTDDGVHESDTTHKTVGIDEMLMIYPANMPNGGDEKEIRAEFINSMMRTKSKAQKDAIIATGLIPVSFAIDLLAMLVWPFGGLVEIDSVWAYSSIRGAKIARSTTKRLNSSDNADGSGKPSNSENQLKLSFTPSARLDVLQRYLIARCHERDAKLFPLKAGPAPTETEVLEAIGWSPRQNPGAEKNWEDEQWEIAEVKEDFKQVMGKGAREWDKWCKAFEKNPEKALKK